METASQKAATALKDVYGTKTRGPVHLHPLKLSPSQVGAEFMGIRHWSGTYHQPP